MVPNYRGPVIPFIGEGGPFGEGPKVTFRGTAAFFGPPPKKIRQCPTPPRAVHGDRDSADERLLQARISTNGLGQKGSE